MACSNETPANRETNETSFSRLFALMGWDEDVAMPQAAKEREVRAYLALQGLSGAAGRERDWRVILAEVLRSSVPLSAGFREVLAEAFEGDFVGFRLELLAEGGKKSVAKICIQECMRGTSGGE